MPSIPDSASEQFLRAFMDSHSVGFPGRAYWVGYRTSPVGVTFWVDGAPFNNALANWGPSHPENGECGAWNINDHSRTWWDLNCESGKPFACFVPNPDTSAPPTPVPTQAPSPAPTLAPGTVVNHPFECNGRDEECVFNRHINKWVCTYEMHVTQWMVNRIERPTVIPGVIDELYSFPILIDETAGGEWASLYYRDCVNDGGISNYVTAETANCTTRVPIDPQFYGGQEGGPIILDGFIRRVSAVNGMIPAPTLCVGFGDIIRAHVINDFTGGYEATAMHWHGMFQRDSFWMDGPSHITQCPIIPHGEFTYQFEADPVGTFWYHAHSGVQIADGVFGALIVQHEPEIEQQVYGTTFDVEEPDEIMMLCDWEHENYQTVMARHPGHWVDDEGMFQANPLATEDGQFTSGHPFVSGHINGHGSFGGNNLRPYVFNVRRGKRVRFRVISAAAMYGFRVSVDDHRITLIAADGLDIIPRVVDGFIIYPAERYDFVLQTTVHSPADLWIRAETMSDDGEVLAIVHVDNDPENPAPAARPTTQSLFTTECEFRQCDVAFCPWPDEYVSNPNIKCFNHADIRRQRDQDAIRNHQAFSGLPDVEDAIAKGNIIPLNFNILGGPSEQLPNVEGIYGTLPHTPPFLNNGVAEDVCSIPEDEFTFKKCNHVYELEHGETYLFVLTNRWPAAANPAIVPNFPGIQTHPVHMHGHSFYVLAESSGTLNGGRFTGPPFDVFGCQNGAANFAFTDYCWDQETIDEDLICNHYAGNCTFHNLPPLTPIAEAPQKDTIPLPVHGWVIIAIVADNPGWWFMHCHIDVHVAEGMNVILSEAPPQTIQLVNDKLPAGFPSCGDFTIPPP